MYTIKVKYKTGDSFNSYDEEDDVGLVWESRELARKALASIKEQYELYQNDSFTYSQKNSVARSKEWCKNLTEEYADYFEGWKYCIAVEMDNGEYRNLSTSWNGYFERLYSAEVIELGSSEDKFETGYY